jgi:hypothetical protein
LPWISHVARGSHAQLQPCDLGWLAWKAASIADPPHASQGGAVWTADPWWRPVTRAEGLLGCFDAAEQPTDFGLPVAAMPTQGADARQLACLSPPGDGATYAVPIDVNRGIQP